ncbi:hypothetical protein [Pseudoalteromonas rubra]|uniref:hypothetical protein n=1 Tax=Pseudoalteromonas rubra TaxID=43658 RepID=UPI002DBA43D2|nr:hypothetical protein [Pseudoalteromonas rubra]MEC4091591.1 hypothetical protein [Pseudoalteromonas rubra]
MFGSVGRAALCPEQRLEMIRQVHNQPFERFAAQCLKVRSKEGPIVPFKMNQAQLYAHRKVQEQKQKIGKVRAAILKARQQGFSTWIGGRYYKITINRVGFNTFILSHENATTGKLAQMVKRYHEHCPTPIKPTLDRDSASLGMSFKSLDSSYELGTARNAETGRGFTAQLFHGSEVAFWPKAAQILAGVMQAVPNVNGSEIMLESTANGQGGAFYDYVMDARFGRGEFILIFSPWYWDPGYKSPVPEGFERTQEEKELAEMVAMHPDGPQFSCFLSDEQLMWRRIKIHELKSNDLFKQEYPSYIDEAFLASGRPVFDPLRVLDAKHCCRLPDEVLRWQGDDRFEPVKTAGFEVVYDHDNNPVGYDFKDCEGYLQLWGRPTSNGIYAIGADVSEGLEHGDYCSFDIVDELGVQIGHYHGHLEMSRYGELLNAVGRMFNDAYMGVESNNHGHAVILRLKQLAYPRQHIMQNTERQHEKTTHKVGWTTDKKSKPEIIHDVLGAALFDESSGIQCIHTADQCLTYVYHNNGSLGAREGCYDDCVMSYAITLKMADVMPRLRPNSPAPQTHSTNGSLYS